MHSARKFQPQNKFIILRWEKSPLERISHVAEEQPTPGFSQIEYLSTINDKLAWVKLPVIAHEFTAKKDARVVLAILKDIISSKAVLGDPDRLFNYGIRGTENRR